MLQWKSHPQQHPLSNYSGGLALFGLITRCYSWAFWTTLQGGPHSWACAVKCGVFLCVCNSRLFVQRAGWFGFVEENTLFVFLDLLFYMIFLLGRPCCVSARCSGCLICSGPFPFGRKVICMTLLRLRWLGLRNIVWILCVCSPKKDRSDSVFTTCRIDTYYTDSLDKLMGVLQKLILSPVRTESCQRRGAIAFYPFCLKSGQLDGVRMGWPSRSDQWLYQSTGQRKNYWEGSRKSLTDIQDYQ